MRRTAFLAIIVILAAVGAVDASATKFTSSGEALIPMPGHPGFYTTEGRSTDTTQRRQIICLGCKDERPRFPRLSGLTSEEQACWDLIQRHRRNNGRAPLQLDMGLVQASRAWSVTMSRSGFRHGAGGENIAAGRPTGAGTFEQWKNSPGHNRFLLSANITRAGVGHAPGGGRGYSAYWTFRGQ